MRAKTKAALFRFTLCEVLARIASFRLLHTIATKRGLRPAEGTTTTTTTKLSGRACCVTLRETGRDTLAQAVGHCLPGGVLPGTYFGSKTCIAASRLLAIGSSQTLCYSLV